MPRLLDAAKANSTSNFEYYQFGGHTGVTVQSYGTFGGATVELRFSMDPRRGDDVIANAQYTSPGVTSIIGLSNGYVRAVVIGGDNTTNITFDIG